MINIHSATFVTLMTILKNFHGEPYLDIICVFLDTLQGTQENKKSEQA
jgi:hypothetical protein